MHDKLVKYITENSQAFYRLAVSYVHESHTAMDVVQNAVVKALENYKTLRNPDYLKTWFYRILINECVNSLRKSGHETALDPETLQGVMELPESNIISDASFDVDTYVIFEEVQKLPPKFKAIIILRFYEDFSLSDISEITGLGLSTVKYRLYAALELLRKNLKEAF